MSAIAAPATSQAVQWPRDSAHPPLERGDAVLVTRAQHAGVVHARLEVALHGLADRPVLVEDRRTRRRTTSRVRVAARRGRGRSSRTDDRVARWPIGTNRSTFMPPGYTLSARFGYRHSQRPAFTAPSRAGRRCSQKWSPTVDAVLLGDDLAIELRVHQRHVVALAVVVAVHLPVRGDVVRQPVAVGELFERLVGGGREERAVVVGQRPGVGIEIDEHEAAPLVDAHRVQGRTRRGRGRRRRSRAPTRSEPSQGVRPTVVAADEIACSGPCASVTSGPARWRQTLWNARSVPSSCDDDDDVQPANSCTHVVAGFLELRANAASCHCRAKTCTRSAAYRCGSTYARAAVRWSRARGYAPVTVQLPMTWAFIFWYSSSLRTPLALRSASFVS